MHVCSELCLANTHMRTLFSPSFRRCDQFKLRDSLSSHSVHSENKVFPPRQDVLLRSGRQIAYWLYLTLWHTCATLLAISSNPQVVCLGLKCSAQSCHCTNHLPPSSWKLLPDTSSRKIRLWGGGALPLSAPAATWGLRPFSFDFRGIQEVHRRKIISVLLNSKR